MIRINLAQRRQASYLSGAPEAGTGLTEGLTGTFATGGKLDSLKNSLSTFKGEEGAALLKRVMVPIGLGVALYFGSDFYFEQERERLAEELVGAEKTKSELRKELDRIKGFEKVKVELEQNELILKTKIATIEKLIVDRDFTLKTWVALSQSLPKEVWLTDLVANDIGYSIKASTTDIGLVSDVMTRLGKTIYFKDITLKGTTSDGSGKTAMFELTARRD